MNRPCAWLPVHGHLATDRGPYQAVLPTYCSTSEMLSWASLASCCRNSCFMILHNCSDMPQPGICVMATDLDMPGVVARRTFCRLLGQGMSNQFCNDWLHVRTIITKSSASLALSQQQGEKHGMHGKFCFQCCQPSVGAADTCHQLNPGGHAGFIEMDL